jgi:Fe-S oxidoreductase
VARGDRPEREAGEAVLYKIAMTLLILASLGAFAARVRELGELLRLGRDDDRRPRDRARKLKDFAVVVLGQRKLLQWSIPGIMHFLIFWGFVVLLTTIVEAFGAVYQDGFRLPLVGSWGPLGLLQDGFVIAVLAGVAMALAIRKLQRPGRFRGSHLREADYILGAIAAIMVTVVLARGTQIAAGEFPYDVAWTPVSNAVARLFTTLSPSALAAFDTVFLWWHSLLVLGFLVYLTYSKHLHILTSGVNVLLTSERPKGALAPLHLDLEELSEDDVLGAAKVTDLSWKQLLDGMTCTECGRCQSQCPAWNTAKPLSPKLLVMDIRDNLFREGPALLAAKRRSEEAYAAAVAELPNLNPDVVEDEVVWDCTTCGACVQACPVNIEHIDAIVDMRRNLVMSESRFPREMQGALQNLETTGNPWGQPPATRLDWAKNGGRGPLKVPSVGEAPDAEVLFWVGCAGAFDDRNQKVVYSFARLMEIAGVSFAVLGPEESCTGDPARRMGAEHIFQMLAQENIEKLDAVKPKRIVTTCPHCFNTLFNEYPQFGGNYDVVHHTEYLAELVRDGRLRPTAELDANVTYHDPCYNARHNDIWKGAREIVEAIPGASYEELHRHGHSTFCCGAGGGRMWMEERMGKKMNLERTDEALASASSTLAVGCPYCNIMLSDGITERHADKEMAVSDVAQLLLGAVDDGGAKVDDGRAKVDDGRAKVDDGRATRETP